MYPKRMTPLLLWGVTPEEIRELQEHSGRLGYGETQTLRASGGAGPWEVRSRRWSRMRSLSPGHGLAGRGRATPGRRESRAGWLRAGGDRPGVLARARPLTPAASLLLPVPGEPPRSVSVTPRTTSSVLIQWQVRPGDPTVLCEPRSLRGELGGHPTPNPGSGWRGLLVYHAGPWCERDLPGGKSGAVV